MAATVSFCGLTFTADDIEYLKVHKEAALLTDNLPVDTLTVAVWSSTDFRPQLRRDTEIAVRWDGKVDALFYDGKAKKLGDLYTITAQSAVGLLDHTYHPGGIYHGETAGQLLTGIMGNIPYSVDPEIAAARFYDSWLPYDTRRNNLRQILLATGATVRRDAAGRLNITVLSNAVAGTFDDDRVFKGGTLAEDSVPTAVQVTEHRFLAADNEMVLYEGTLSGRELIQFADPAHDLACTGGAIVESSANHAVISAQGAVRLVGKGYTHTTRVITEGAILNTPEDAVYPMADAYLVGPMNAAAVAKRLYAYVQNVKTIQQDVLLSGEQPGDLVRMADPTEDTVHSAALQALDIVYSGVRKASATALIGYVPQGGSTGFKNRRVFAANGNFTVPAGVTLIHVVVGQAGTGGTAGGQGKNGELGPSYSTSHNTGVATITTHGYAYGKAGDGGEPGGGGIPGKVLEMDLDVTPGQTFAVNLGVGGEGGDFDDTNGPQPGKPGGESSFGTLFSAAGAIPAGGFVEIMTGDVYAQTGGPGVAGCKGSGAISSDGTETAEGPQLSGPGGPWGPGGIGETKRDYAGWDYSAYCEGRGHGGLGGGAAFGANGNSGKNGSANVYKLNDTQIDGTVWGGVGGDGATPIPNIAQTVPGSGGPGGHGGGGGGGPGPALQEDTKWSNPRQEAEIVVSARRAKGGVGGKGSKGGKGGPGFVIVYW